MDLYSSQRGEIYNIPYFTRARVYSWQRCIQYAPRNIAPTDIDFVVECKGKFLFFEMKTDGAIMPRGQVILYEQLLTALATKAVLMVVTHKQLDIPTMPDDIIGIETWRYINGYVRKKQHGGNMHDVFIALYSRFFQWAEEGR